MKKENKRVLTGRFREEYDMAIGYATKWAEFNNEKVEPAPEDKLN